MPNRYKKTQPKITPLPFIIIGVILVVTILLVIFLRDTPQEKFYKQYVGYGAADLAEDHVFKEISFKSFNKKLKDGEEMLVYIGKVDCQVCVTEVPLYDKEFKSDDLKMGDHFKNIYYLNVGKLKEKEIEKLIGDYYYNEQEPLFLYFSEGEVVIDRYMFGDNPSATLQGEIYNFLKAVKQEVQK